jgi:hypothetical protein
MKSGGGSGWTALISSAGAAGLFFGFWLVLGVPLPWSAGAGVAGYAALWLLASGLRGIKKPETAASLTDYVDIELARKTVASGRASAAALRSRIPELGRGNPLVGRGIRIAELLEAIASDVESDPKDAPAAHAFLDYQGDAASRLVKLAIDLAKRGGSPDQIAEAQAKLERTFALLEGALEHHLARLQEDNLAELQSELEVLEESLLTELPLELRMADALPETTAAEALPPQEAADMPKAVSQRRAPGSRGR